jgi:hypothetical protein
MTGGERRARRRAPAPDVGAGRNGNGLARWAAGSGEQGAFSAPGPVHEDAGDDRRVGDDGHDAHRRGTARAREGLDLEAAVSRQPSAVSGRQRPDARGGLGSPGSGSRTSRSSVSSPDPGEQLERVQGRGADRGPVRRSARGGARRNGRPRRTKSRSTARRKASLRAALSYAGQPGQRTKVPSGRKPPSVTTRWRWGCQLASEPWVWMPEAQTRTGTGAQRDRRTDARGGHADMRTGFSLLLAVRDGGEERLVQPKGPAGQPLGVAAGTEVAALAGEGQQVLVGAARPSAPCPRAPVPLCPCAPVPLPTSPAPPPAPTSGARQDTAHPRPSPPARLPG